MNERVSAPIIVSAELGGADFAWLDGLRQRHFPPERNLLPAHLTLFHHLPPSSADEVTRRLARCGEYSPPPAVAAGLISLGRGVAVRIASEALESIRFDLSQAFVGSLTPQDSAAWRPHVTIQNKVPPPEAQRLLDLLTGEFVARPIAITALAAWYYRGGPWERIGRYAFRGINPAGRRRRS